MSYDGSGRVLTRVDQFDIPRIVQRMELDPSDGAFYAVLFDGSRVRRVVESGVKDLKKPLPESVYWRAERAIVIEWERMMGGAA